MSVPPHVNEAIEEVAGLHGQAERSVPVHQRRIEQLTGALGRRSFLNATILVVVAWIGVNVALPLLGHGAFDPVPFHLLHLVLTVGALLMATVVLSTQERQIRVAEKRGHLDLQINLLSERKIAKVIALLEELRRDLPNVRNRADSEARAMAQRTDPQVVSEALEESIQAELRADEHPAEVEDSKVDKSAP
jgi:uncharacterized membrane protein